MGRGECGHGPWQGGAVVWVPGVALRVPLPLLHPYSRTLYGHGVHLARRQWAVRDGDLVEVVVATLLQAGRGHLLLLLPLLRLLALHGLLRPGRQRGHHGHGLGEGDTLAAFAQGAGGTTHPVPVAAAVVLGQRPVAGVAHVRLIHLSVSPVGRGRHGCAKRDVATVAIVPQQRVPCRGGRRVRRQEAGVVVVVVVVLAHPHFCCVGLRCGQGDKAVGADVVVVGRFRFGERGHLERGAIDGAVVVVIVVVVAAVGGQGGGHVTVGDGRVEVEGLPPLQTGQLHPVAVIHRLVKLCACILCLIFHFSIF